MQELEDNLVTFKEYAASRGIGYEGVRQKVQRLQDNPELKGHIHTIEGVRYLDQDAVNFLDKRQRSMPVTVVSKEQSTNYQKLQLELQEAREDRDNQRNEKEEYMKKCQALMEEIMELRANPEKSIDTTKYMLIEDHEKTKRELAEKDETISVLTEENGRLKQDAEDLKDITRKNVELARKIEEKSEKLRSEEAENDKIRRELSDLTIHKNEIEADNRAKDDKISHLEDMMAIQKKEVEEKIAEAEKTVEEERLNAQKQYEEALNMGFFERIKRKKELKNKKA